jgi:hypothetical protein
VSKKQTGYFKYNYSQGVKMKNFILLLILCTAIPARGFAEYDWTVSLDRVRYSSVIPADCDYRLGVSWKQLEPGGSFTQKSLLLQLSSLDASNHETKAMHFTAPASSVFNMASYSTVANSKFFKDGYDASFRSTYSQMISDGKGPRPGEFTVRFNSRQTPLINFQIPGFSSGSWSMNADAFTLERQCSDNAVTELMYYLSR